MPAKNKTQQKTEKVNSTIARSDDGTIQITFTIPYKQIEKHKAEAVKELVSDIEIPGFRRGKAPPDKVIDQIPQNTLIEKTLSKILPKLAADAINQHKIKPAIYPKFELVKATENEAWQIRAVTCEIPDVKLGNYKKVVAGAARAKRIWTPEKGSKEKPKEPTREEKEQEVIKTLLETIKVRVPNILVEEEVNSRLARLLERLEKLGLTLEGYLSSIRKDSQAIRKEYEEQARNTLVLDIILSKIAESENIKVDDKQVDAAVAAGSATSKLAERLNTPEQRRIIESILRRRAALDSLVSLL